jgi:flagellar biosynthesis protein FlhB
MMDNWITGVLRLLLWLFLASLALVFVCSLLVVLALMAGVWGLRALWARLTGQAVAPWVMRVNPGAGWSRVFRAGDRWQPAARAARGPGSGTRDLVDVTDVQVKEL